MRRFGLCLALSWLGVVAAWSAPTHPVDPTYAALRGDRLDGRSVEVSGMVLERDVFRFKLDSGTFSFLKPVAGHAVGAVFRGKGSYRLVPATEGERRELALQTGEDRKFEVLADTFDEMVLWFGDDTAAEIERAGTLRSGSPDAGAADALERANRRMRKDFHINVALRLLAEDANAATPGQAGVFLVYVNGKRYPPAFAAVDPRGLGGLGFGAETGGDETALLISDSNQGGLWYLSHLRREMEAHQTHPMADLAEAFDYRVDSRVTLGGGNPELAGTTTVRLAATDAGLRVLRFDLLPQLRIESAQVSPADQEAWKDVPFVQEDKDEDGDAAVVFPEPLAKGKAVALRLTYRGLGVLHDAGGGSYVVSARASWYPNLGAFAHLATYELRYRVPKGNEVVSVGTLIDSRTEGNESVSTWTTDLPIRVAGFNFGKFKKLSKTDAQSGFAVDVYSAAATPDIVYELERFLSAQGNLNPEEDTGAPVAEGSLLKTDRLAGSVLAQALYADRVFSTYFGPLPERRVAITQQVEWNYGQSWPSLIFMPYMAFLPSIQRAQIGLSRASDFVEDVCFHEFAHQWWGHLLGWSSYRDQWLSEGFAEFSAALAVQFSGGPARYDHFWKQARKTLFERHTGDAMPPNDAAPVDLGGRASTHRSPSGFRVMYSKGAYVLEMLRSMMIESGTPNPDARFIAMMKDFVSAYTRKAPSTADFQKVVERHMTPAMDLAGDHRMDWFFDQWVHGTEVPRYRSDLAVKKEGDKYRVSGRVAQEGVSERFAALVPLDVELAKGKTARLGTLRITGASSVPVDLAISLPEPPKRVTANAHGEVLARD
ncbi:MAG TPA: M1 family aminopeptidase [Thermoanaerobaculia bacterium]|jgi:hypothetical protein